MEWEEVERLIEPEIMRWVYKVELNKEKLRKDACAICFADYLKGAKDFIEKVDVDGIVLGGAFFFLPEYREAARDRPLLRRPKGKDVDVIFPRFNDPDLNSFLSDFLSFFDNPGKLIPEVIPFQDTLVYEKYFSAGRYLRRRRLTREKAGVLYREEQLSKFKQTLLCSIAKFYLDPTSIAIMKLPYRIARRKDIEDIVRIIYARKYLEFDARRFRKAARKLIGKQWKEELIYQISDLDLEFSVDVAEYVKKL